MPDEMKGNASAVEAAEAAENAAPKDAKPAGEPSTPAPDTTQPSGADKPAVGTERPPFHQDPEVQSYLEKQLQKRQEKMQRDWDKKFQEQKDLYTRQLENFNSRSAQPSGTQKPPLTGEQRQAREELAEMLFGDPEIRDKYGLSKVDQLVKQQQEMLLDRSREVFDAELSPLVQKAAEKYGMDAKELDAEIRDFVSTDPWFEDKNFTRGSASKVVRLFFADKESELAEREANLKIIREQNEKKRVGTEKAASNGKPGSRPLESSLDAYLERRAKEDGLTFE